MECADIKKLLPIYLDKELDASTMSAVRAHVAMCAACAKELQLLAKSWSMLGELTAIEPKPGYVSAFWTRVAAEVPWHKKLLTHLELGLKSSKLAPAFAAVCVALVVGLAAILNVVRLEEEKAFIAQNQDIEFFEEIELAQDLDILEDLEFLEDLDVIEQWDSKES